MTVVPAYVWSANPRTVRMIFVGLLIVGITVIYAQTWSHQFLNFDDNQVITANAVVQDGLTSEGVQWAFTTFTTSNWLPLTWLSHMAAVSLFGVSFAGPHILVNVLLHLIASLLLFFFLERATGATVRSGIVTLLFALHPLRVESVAWVAERKDVLSACFWMAACWAYVGYAQRRTLIRYSSVLSLFALGILSKPMVVTLPVILLVVDFWPLNRISFRPFDAQSAKKLLLEKLPFFVVSIAASAVTIAAQRQAISSVESVPRLVRVGNAALSYVTYLWKTFVPAKLAVIYPLSAVNPVDAMACVVVLCVVTGLVLWNGTRWPSLASGWLWYLITLLPVIGLVQVGVQAEADRYTYIPSVGILVMVVWGLGAFAGRHEKAIAPAALATFAVVVLLVGLSFVQARYWHDSVSLFSRTVQVTRENDVAHAVLAQAYEDRGDTQRAIGEYEAALRINPEFPEARNDLMRLSASMPPEQVISIHQRIVDSSPSDAEAHFGLGKAFLTNGMRDDAAREFRRAVDLGAAPADRSATYRAYAFAAAGNATEAMREFRGNGSQAAEAASVLNDAGAALAQEGDLLQAIASYKASLLFEPAFYDAHMNLGAAYSRNGADESAIAEFHDALRSRPDSVEPRVYLALSLANAGRKHEAATVVEEALRINALESNKFFTAALRLTPAPDNLTSFLRQIRGESR